MIGKTHRSGGTAFALVGFEIMRQQELLIPDVNPILQLVVLYPVAQWASTLPDLDHHWGSVGGKTPVNWVCHKLLHLTKPKHRSWQTHSLLFSGGLLYMLFTLVTLGPSLYEGFSGTDWIIARILVYGLVLGYASHLFLDAINPSGIHLYPGKKIRFVPRTKFFATGGVWETRWVYPACLIISGVAFISTLFGLMGIELSDVIVSWLKTV